MANKCLFANLWLFGIGEGDEATSPSFITCYALIQASSASLEMLIVTWYVQWDPNRSTLPTVNKGLFANRLLFASGEGDDAASPSFTTSYAQIEASSTLLDTLIVNWYMQWECKREHSTHSKQILVCQSLVLGIGEGHQKKSSPFAVVNAAINGPSALLEALIATRRKRVGWKREHLVNGKWLPICQSFLLYEWRGRRGIFYPVSNCKCGDQHFQCVA